MRSPTAQIRSTDHLAVSMKIHRPTNNRGKGVWKLNSSVFKDAEYNELIKYVFNNFISKVMHVG